MAAEKDLFDQLKPLSFKGIELPVSGRSVGFQHDAAKHKFVFKDKELIEPLGRRNLTFRYTVPMRESIAKGNFEYLFSDVLAKLLALAMEREPGPLYDPIYGEFQAHLVSWNERLDVLKRDGVDLEIEFVHAPEPDEEMTGLGDALLTTLDTIKSDAGLLDTEAAKVDWEQLEPPETTVDPLAAAEGAIKLAELTGAQFSAAVEGVANRIERVKEAVESLGSPEAWPLTVSGNRVAAKIEEMKRTTDSAGESVHVYTTPYAMSFSSLASKLSTTVGSLLKLNPYLADAGPSVAKGTQVRHTGKE